MKMLEGIKVLDFTQYLSGPTVTRLMAEMGAEIIKIETAPGGDPSRLLPVVEAARALGAKAPTVGAVAVLGTTDVELGPYIEARLGFLGVAPREIALARLAAGR